jgi:hypothetical protein
MANTLAGRSGSALRGLAVISSALATAAALLVAAVLAVFFAATVAVIALMSSALLGFAGLAMRARRTARARRDGVIEAHRVGGHHWVAYGWNEPR